MTTCKKTFADLPSITEAQDADLILIYQNGVKTITKADLFTGLAGSGVWGEITGTLSDQTDLQAALDLKANSGDLSAVATSGDYNDLLNLPSLFSGSYNDLTDVPATFPPSAHTHPISEVIGLQTALDLKANSADLAAVATSGSYTDLINVPSTFPPSAHTHPISEIVGLQTALDAKADAVDLSNHIADTSNPHSVSLEQARLVDNQVYGTIEMLSGFLYVYQGIVLTSPSGGSIFFENADGYVEWTGGQRFYVYNSDGSVNFENPVGQILFNDFDNNRYGFGTFDTLYNYGSSAGDFPLTTSGIHLDSGNTQGVIALEGNSQAAFYIADRGEALNKKIYRINNDAQKLTIDRVSDNLGTNTTYLTINDGGAINTVGNFTVGGNLYVTGTADFTGAVTGIALDEIENPAGDVTFTLGGNTVVWNFTNPVGGMQFNFTGGWSGHALTIEDTSPVPNGSAGDHLLHVESDRVNVVPGHFVNETVGAIALKASGDTYIDGNLTAVDGITVSAFSSAGFIKNDASGILSGGNTISTADLTDIALTDTNGIAFWNGSQLVTDANFLWDTTYFKTDKAIQILDSSGVAQYTMGYESSSGQFRIGTTGLTSGVRFIYDASAAQIILGAIPSGSEPAGTAVSFGKGSSTADSRTQPIALVGYSTGSVAPGFGAGYSFVLEDDASSYPTVAYFGVEWLDPTNGADKSQLYFAVRDRTVASSPQDVMTLSQDDMKIYAASITVDAFSSAGFVKNDASGVLSGGNSIGTGDLPSTVMLEGENISLLTNDSGYITGVNWDEIGGTQSDVNVSGFTNDAGYISGITGEAINDLSDVTLDDTNGIAYWDGDSLETDANLTWSGSQLAMTGNAAFSSNGLTNDATLDIVTANIDGTGYGVRSQITSSSPDTNIQYAGYFYVTANNINDDNYAVYASASGSTNDNWAIYAAAGKNYFAAMVGIGVEPSYMLDIVYTGSQIAALAIDYNPTSSGYGILIDLDYTGSSYGPNHFGIYATVDSSVNATNVYGAQFLVAGSGGSGADGYGVVAYVSDAGSSGIGLVGVINSANMTSGAAVYGAVGTSTTPVISGTLHFAGYFTGGDVYVSDSIGVSETQPLALLHLNAQSPSGDAFSTGATAILENSTGHNYIVFHANSGSSGYHGLVWGDTADTFVSTIRYQHSTNQLQFYVNNGYAMYINSDQSVGIGTASTNSKALRVIGGLQSDGYYSSDGSAGATGSFFDLSGNSVTVKNGLITSFS